MNALRPVKPAVNKAGPSFHDRSAPSGARSEAPTDEQFPLGTMTMGLPEWYAIVGLANRCQEHFKPFRNILAHMEIGSTPQEIYDRMAFSHDKLWQAFNLLNTLVQEIKIQNEDP